MEGMRAHTERVVEYYNQTRWEYTHLWRSHERLAIHFGYFDETIRHHRQSLTKMTEVLARHLNITQADRVLDAGCGIGGCALWLAENIGCRVTGLNITPYQLNIAHAAAQERGMDDLVNFVLMDFTRTGLKDQSFSAIWALESIVHAERKHEFAAEAWRLLRPGGRLMIAEYLLRDDPSLTEQDYSIMKPWLEGWAMPNLLSEREYRQLLERTGFSSIEVTDISTHVAPSLRRLDWWTKRLLPTAPIFHYLKIINQGQVKNAQAAAAQIRAFKAGLWQYKVLVAHRPSD
jgi:tocopherol O-methyltransferase